MNSFNALQILLRVLYAQASMFAQANEFAQISFIWENNKLIISLRYRTKSNTQTAFTEKQKKWYIYIYSKSQWGHFWNGIIVFLTIFKMAKETKQPTTIEPIAKEVKKKNDEETQPNHGALTTLLLGIWIAFGLWNKQINLRVFGLVACFISMGNGIVFEYNFNTIRLQPFPFHFLCVTVRLLPFDRINRSKKAVRVRPI